MRYHIYRIAKKYKPPAETAGLRSWAASPRATMASGPEPVVWRRAPAVAAGWRPVTTAFVQRQDGRVLVVRRSDKVSTYRGLWGGVSGGLEDFDASLQARALAEVQEEAGISPILLRLAARGRPLPVRDGGRKFLVHPFLFTLAQSGATAAPGGSSRDGSGGCDDGSLANRRAQPVQDTATVGVDAVAAADPPVVTLNWENWEARWVTFEEVAQLPQVPLLTETLQRVLLPPHMAKHVDYLTTDRVHGAAQLAGYTVQAFQEVATFEQQACTSGQRDCSGQVVLESYRDFGFHLACARPSMAAIANAAADVLTALDTLLQQHATTAGATSAGLPASAVHKALLEACRTETQRLQARGSSLHHAVAGLLARPGVRVMTVSYSSTLLAALSSMAPTLGGVVCCESRPLCEGVALARALAAAGVRGVSVITDAQAAAFVGAVDLVMLGADELGTGGAVNKVGSRMVALAAREAGVPVYVCADRGKLGAGVTVSALVELPHEGSGSTSASKAQHETVQHGGSSVGCGGGEEKGPEEVMQGWPPALMQLGGSSGSGRGGGSETETVLGAAAGGAAAKLQQTGSSESIIVRNVYFEAVPLALLTGGVVTEQGVLDHSKIPAACEARRAQYLSAFGLATLEQPPEET